MKNEINVTDTIPATFFPPSSYHLLLISVIIYHIHMRQQGTVSMSPG